MEAERNNLRFASTRNHFQRACSPMCAVLPASTTTWPVVNCSLHRASATLHSTFAFHEDLTHAFQECFLLRACSNCDANFRGNEGEEARSRFADCSLLRADSASARKHRLRHVSKHPPGSHRAFARDGVRFRINGWHRSTPYRFSQFETGERMDARPAHSHGLQQRSSRRLGRVRDGMAATKYVGAHDVA